jgi:hypothetical protein
MEMIFADDSSLPLCLTEHVDKMISTEDSDYASTWL